MIVLFGLKNCDRCRAARRWLEERGYAVRFVDLRVAPPDAALLDRWIDAAGLEAVLNRRSRTWAALAPEDREVSDPAELRALLLARPTLIKRPVIDLGRRIVVGFSPAIEAELERVLERQT
ncbi:MAG: arsenate reductase [Alphaproteobacteria bacterium]|nr:MAG: arsenate reductase [Alphaproteobacteria bacterium]